MGIFFIYTVKSSLCLAVFYLFYKLLLSRETFHRFNRFALLGLLVLSAVLPLVEVGVKQPVPMQQPLLTLEQLLALAEPSVEASVAQPATAGWVQALLLVYLAGMAFFLGRNLWSLGRLAVLLRSGRVEPVGDYLPGRGRGVQLVTHDRDLPPFSWMRFIVISRRDLQENGREILIHELAHIRGGHSWDLLLADLCIFVQWFNPAAWLLKRELQNIHEYEADETVIREGVDAKHYQLLLIRKAVGTRLYSMANSFNHSKLKKRITMMMKEKSNPWARMKYAYVLPLAALAVTAFARPEVSEASREISSAKVSNLMGSTQVNFSQTVPGAVADTVRILRIGAGKMDNVKEDMQSSVNNDASKALIVIDGVIKEGIDLSTIDPNDIKSMTVLKDATAIKKYGDKGKDGVIEIDTKAASHDAGGNPVKQVHADKALIVVDGIIKEGIDVNTINPDDIESVTVLKDATAIKKYGDKGKDGVIEISTKASAYDAEGNLKVNGLVTDEQGEPIIGATIVIGGTNRGTVTDRDGKFRLAAPEGSVLEVSYIGFTTAKVEVASLLTVKLKQE